MRFKVIACGVFEPELARLATGKPEQMHVTILDAGLHAEPQTLRTRVQDHIDSAAAAYDAIVVLYGMCGRGTSGLVAREVPVILPRVHDCVSLFMGSAAEYRRQFAEHPGTFYFTAGWYKYKVDPRARILRWRPETVTEHPDFAELAARHGAENATDILLFHDSWKGNYTRAAYIETAAGDDAGAEAYARRVAASLGWEYQRIAGDAGLIERVLSGQWDEREVFVLRPGQRSALSGDDRVFTSVDLGGSVVTNGKRVSAAAQRRLDPGPASSPCPELGLGIDAGGTYTDCALWDFATAKTLSKAKALSTPHDLIVGIEEALDRLELTEPERIGVVALSTTLATNSIVEGKGGRPGLILTSAVTAGLDQITWRPRRVVPGALAIDGYEIAALDEQATRQAISELLAEGIDALAISGYAGTKNPAHEQRIKQIAEQMCDLPVVCGHELSSRLNYVERANTAVLNARLLPLIRDLVEAARAALERRGISGRLMVVKSDGTLVNERTACERPIETILSGPAASVAGARALTGQTEAVVVDMGGTTTDTAMLERGTVRIGARGATVGRWQTSVEAAELKTIGLGGDSYLQFTGDRKLLVGPRRVVPLSYLAARYPTARAALMAMRAEQIPHRASAAWLDFFVLGRPPRRPLPPREARVVELLAQGPLSRSQLAARLGLVSPTLLSLPALEDEGIVQRAALTPTDLLHCDGRFTAWDGEAAARALAIFAELYGATPGVIEELVEQAIVRRLCMEILGAALNGRSADWEQGGCGACSVILDTVFEPDEAGAFAATFTYRRPIIAIGAPVWAYFPRVGRFLNAEVLIPEHAEVANAIGAVTSEVVVRERATVRPGEISNYVLHWREGRREFDTLQEAIAAAHEAAGEVARRRARAAGSDGQDVRYEVAHRRALSAEGEQLTIEVTVEATVSGRPTLTQA